MHFSSVKEWTSKYLRYRLVYKFNCATCNSCYIGETCRHFQTRIDEQIRTDENSSIYKHLHQSEDCVNSFTFDCFSILDTTPKKY